MLVYVSFRTWVVMGWDRMERSRTRDLMDQYHECWVRVLFSQKHVESDSRIEVLLEAQSPVGTNGGNNKSVQILEEMRMVETSTTIRIYR